MPGLMIRNVPPEIHKQLKARARSHRRSLTAEVLVILEESLADRAGPASLDEIDRMRIHGNRLLDSAILQAAREEGRP